MIYKEFFEGRGIPFVSETEGARANYWLMTILLEDRIQRDNFLAFSNERKVMTRPAWQLMNTLPMYKDCPAGDLSSAQRLADRIVNIPSSVRIKK